MEQNIYGANCHVLSRSTEDVILFILSTWHFSLKKKDKDLDTMLKWLGGSSAAAGSSGGNGVDSLTHIGKTFTVGEFQVVVEELIAEGKSIIQCVDGKGVLTPNLGG